MVELVEIQTLMCMRSVGEIVSFKTPLSTCRMIRLPFVVDFNNVSTVGLESSSVAKALAGLRANEARYYMTKYKHEFTVVSADKSQETLDCARACRCLRSRCRSPSRIGIREAFNISAPLIGVAQLRSRGLSFFPRRVFSNLRVC